MLRTYNPSVPLINVHPRAVISEFGAGNNDICFQVTLLSSKYLPGTYLHSQFVDDLLKYMAANDVYIGWSAWAAGPRTSTETLG